MKKLSVLFAVLLATITLSFAQKPSRIGYVDMDYILANLEDYKVANQQFALQVEQWQAEIEKRLTKIQAEKDKLEAEKALLTPELIKDKEEEIALMEYNLNAYKQQKFDAKDGEYINQKFLLAKPIQDQVFNIVQEIGKLRKYDFIFEKSDATILFSNEQHNLSKVVLRALKKKDNAADRNKDMAELLKESYDFEFVEERVKKRKEAEKQAPIFVAAQEMLRQWEAGNPEVMKLWKQMNGWVYDGFAVTYKNLGVDFNSYYYESNTYLLGKDIVEQGLQKGVFFKKEDGSVWCDLTADGLDEKLVLRADGTSVYITQDMGTAIQRVKDYPDVKGMVYTVGNEQDYHFKVLFLILKKLGYDWASHLYHLSYGMVDLPSGKMKSREGTVVDADDLIAEMEQTAKVISQELGKLDGYTEAQKEDLYHTIGLGALKYYILKVDPKKRILFDPKESIDFQGNTGPFIQYTYARIQSILRKYAETNNSKEVTVIQPDTLQEKEKNLLKSITLFPSIVQDAADNYSPAVIANYVYDLVKDFNSFYQNVSILGEEDASKRHFRVALSKKIGELIAESFKMLGIQVPERM